MSLERQWLVPDWPAPPGVRAFATTRTGGVSQGEYASMNLGMSSGDDPARVAENRRIVRAALPADPVYMRQAHGVDAVRIDRAAAGESITADAAVTSRGGPVAVVLTADCMPLLLAHRGGGLVAAVHAGWRGMSAGVIESAVEALGEPGGVVAWMGPTIGPAAFEVGPEVREAFLRRDARADGAFHEHRPGKFMADLYELARRRLTALGVREVHGGGFCTRGEADRFFSYRRHAKSGRMGAFIWVE